MPTCPICTSEDFVLQDGHYFCNECSTQSQEIREEIEDVESSYLLTNSSKRRKVRSGSSSSKGSSLQPDIQDGSRAWHLCEAMNLIIYHQVEALVKLGSSPLLKDVVMDLWFQYLKSCGLAFSSTQEDWKPSLPTFPITRWIREGHIPYLNAYRLMPESMILNHNDISILKTIKIPNPNYITRQSTKILEFLKKRDIPSQPVCLLAVRFIMDLNLPSELASVINRLVTVTCPGISTFLNQPFTVQKKKRWNYIPRYDLQAASLVIVAMKIIFGLNGETERDLSILARDLNSQDTQTGRHVFVWDDWETQVTLNLNLQKSKNVSSVIFSAQDSLDVGMLGSWCKEMRMKINSKNIVFSNKYHHIELTKTFAKLCTQKVFVKCRPSSFPVTASTSECISGEHEVAYFLRDFTSCTLPRVKESEADHFGYWRTFGWTDQKAVGQSINYLKTLPYSAQVLISALRYLTSCRALDIVYELASIERMLVPYIIF